MTKRQRNEVRRAALAFVARGEVERARALFAQLGESYVPASELYS